MTEQKFEKYNVLDSSLLPTNKRDPAKRISVNFGKMSFTWLIQIR